jgi:transcriptional regulator with XRE-family HTH domain
MHWEENVPGARLDWSGWIKGLGKQARRVREFLGLSQEQVARLAGVSQGAVSRFEGGRGLATPLLVVMKVNAALRSGVAAMDHDVLSDDARRLFSFEAYGLQEHPEAAPPITKEPELEELIRLYRDLPERQRQRLLTVVRATAAALGAPDGASVPERLRSSVADAPL